MKSSNVFCIDTETTAIRYYGQFRVPDLDYVDKYGNYTSDEYVKLAEEVRMTVSYIQHIACACSHACTRVCRGNYIITVCVCYQVQQCK